MQARVDDQLDSHGGHLADSFLTAVIVKIPPVTKISKKQRIRAYVFAHAFHFMLMAHTCRNA